MTVAIVCDSSCDITQDEARELDITVLPLKTIIDGEEYLDGVTISPVEFYEKLSSCKELPTTSQATPHDFETILRPIAEAGDEAVVITLSGKFSGTVESARAAAAVAAASARGGDIWVVDSGNVTLGMNILVRYAVQLRARGLGGKEIAEELERVKPRICLLACVDTLEYLMKGGRLSRSAAIAGTILNIKPVLCVEDGEIAVLGKARGSRKSNNLLTEFVLKKGGADYSLPVMIGYSGADDTLLRDYIENSRELWEGKLENLPMTIVGSTIGTHAGPGAIAVAFFANEDER